MVNLTTVRGIGRSDNRGLRRRRPGIRLAVGLLALSVGPGCTMVLRDPGTQATCAPLRYSVTVNDVDVSAARLDAIDDAVAEFATLVGRPVERLAVADATAEDNGPGDPIVFEFAWPEHAPSGLGYAEPHITGSSYDGGWVMLRPTIRNAPVGVIRRLVLHELGHLTGLADVEDPGELMDPSLAASTWGPGDLVGLLVTHDGGCRGTTLGDEFEARIG